MIFKMILIKNPGFQKKLNFLKILILKNPTGPDGRTGGGLLIGFHRFLCPSNCMYVCMYVCILVKNKFIIRYDLAALHARVADLLAGGGTSCIANQILKGSVLQHVFTSTCMRHQLLANCHDCGFFAGHAPIP